MMGSGDILGDRQAKASANLPKGSRLCVTLEEMGGIYGIGYINSRAVHVDTRPKASQWYGDETKRGAPSITKFGYKSFRVYFKM